MGKKKETKFFERRSSKCKTWYTKEVIKTFKEKTLEPVTLLSEREVESLPLGVAPDKNTPKKVSRKQSEN